MSFLHAKMYSNRLELLCAPLFAALSVSSGTHGHLKSHRSPLRTSRCHLLLMNGLSEERMGDSAEINEAKRGKRATKESKQAWLH